MAASLEMTTHLFLSSSEGFAQGRCFKQEEAIAIHGWWIASQSFDKVPQLSIPSFQACPERPITLA